MGKIAGKRVNEKRTPRDTIRWISFARMQSLGAVVALFTVRAMDGASLFAAVAAAGLFSTTAFATSCGYTGAEGEHGDAGDGDEK